MGGEEMEKKGLILIFVAEQSHRESSTLARFRNHQPLLCQLLRIGG